MVGLGETLGSAWPPLTIRLLLASYFGEVPKCPKRQKRIKLRLKIECHLEPIVILGEILISSLCHLKAN
jgi:hypothetical protein